MTEHDRLLVEEIVKVDGLIDVIVGFLESSHYQISDKLFMVLASVVSLGNKWQDQLQNGLD